MNQPKKKRLLAGLCIITGLVCILLANANSLTQTVRAIAGDLPAGTAVFLPYILNVPSETPTYPAAVCTAPYCGPGEHLYCPGICPGGCGYICVTRTPSPTMVPCTPPFCGPGEGFYCPGECPGGCGTICVTSEPGSPTATPTLTTYPISCPVPPPESGSWSGSTGRDHLVSFEVSSNGTQWSNFRLTTDYNLPPCGSGTIEFTAEGPGNILNNQMSYSRDDFAFTGQFTTNQNAQGTYFVSFSMGEYPWDCSTQESGSWRAFTYVIPPPTDIH